MVTITCMHSAGQSHHKCTHTTRWDHAHISPATTDYPMLGTFYCTALQ